MDTITLRSPSQPCVGIPLKGEWWARVAEGDWKFKADLLVVPLLIQSITWHGHTMDYLVSAQQADATVTLAHIMVPDNPASVSRLHKADNRTMPESNWYRRSPESVVIGHRTDY